MTQSHTATLLHFFKALANENRLKIVGILAGRECSVGELASTLELEEPTVSHHLGKLKRAGLVIMRRVGNDHLHRLDLSTLDHLRRELLSDARIASLAEGTTSSDWEEKVLGNFVNGETITAIPAGYKKRLVLLRWLAERFEFGVKYPEKQVNALINRHHEDHAFFRRAMVDEGLMKRENGIYWRVEWQMPEF
ncbi:metalloregulator ArsR/SmtB family transcription factor [Candidatus Fermentibacteria bacterium]|nr:metalloregulator ArsR/SmtB family transcription factor [Candidatus Fermentibacteria bacterium]